MIEKWLRAEIDTKLKNSNRIIILDEFSEWEFLVEAACVGPFLLKRKNNDKKWKQKQDELFLRYNIEKNYKNSDVIVYVQGELGSDSFLVDYAKTGGCIVLSKVWVREALLRETSLQVSLTDEELYTACHVGVKKDLNWWKRVIQKIEDVLTLEDDILQFMDDPNGFMKKQSQTVRNLYIQEFCKLLGQPLQEKPYDTFANEISKHIFEGIINGNIAKREYSIYCKWLDSHEHEPVFKKYLSMFKIPDNIEISKVNDNHCFDEIDRRELIYLVNNLGDSTKVQTSLGRIKRRINNMKKNPYVADWWPDVTDVIDVSMSCKDASIDKISTYYTTHFAAKDRSMRHILAYWKAAENIVRPLQERYEQMNQDMLKVWFAHYDEYKENQKGYLVRLIKDNTKKIAIIVGDGVRYEVADSVASRIEPGINVEKKIMYAGLPSETEHNMSALYTTGGKIIAAKSEREKLLSQGTGKNITYLQLEEVNETTDGDILVLTYKDIDDAGEKMQQAMLKLVNEFEDILVEKIQLLLHLGYKEVHLVTDHGFVLTGILDESDKIPTDDISGSKKVSERYIRSVDEQNNEKYISLFEPYGEYNYVNFAKSSRPFSSTGKYGYSHGGFTPQEVVIPNFIFTYEKTNQLDVNIVNKKDLSEVNGDIVAIKISSADEAVDVMSYQRRVRVVLYTDGKEIDKSSILTMEAGKKESLDLSLYGASEAVVVVIDEDTKDQLDKASIHKTKMRDLGGLL